MEPIVKIMTRSQSRESSASPNPSVKSSRISRKLLKSSLKKEKDSRASSLSSAASTDSWHSVDTATDNDESDDGLYPILKNIHHSAHVALRKKDDESKISADRIIKEDAYKNLKGAIKKERAKVGSQLISYLVEGALNIASDDIPVIPKFNKKQAECP